MHSQSTLLSTPAQLNAIQAFSCTAAHKVLHSSFPGVVGVIDSTHNHIIALSEQENFCQQKTADSIDVQTVFSVDYVKHTTSHYC